MPVGRQVKSGKDQKCVVCNKVLVENETCIKRRETVKKETGVSSRSKSFYYCLGCFTKRQEDFKRAKAEEKKALELKEEALTSD
jgi:methionyl-tRNA synthetase